jgi:uncharacterized membrane protein YeiB
VWSLLTFDIPQTALVATLDTYDFKKHPVTRDDLAIIDFQSCVSGKFFLLFSILFGWSGYPKHLMHL